MTDFNLQFLIFLNADLSVEQLTEYLKQSLPDIEAPAATDFRVSQNVVEVTKHILYDPRQASDPDNSRSYKYQIYVYPIEDDVTAAQQRLLLDRLTQILKPFSPLFIVEDFDD